MLPTRHITRNITRRRGMIHLFSTAPPGNDLWSFFKSYLDINANMGNHHNQSFAHQMYNSLALEVIKSRLDRNFTISELLEGSAQVALHVAELVNQQKFNAVASLCVSGPGRDATSIKKDIMSYGILLGVSEATSSSSSASASASSSASSSSSSSASSSSSSSASSALSSTSTPTSTSTASSAAFSDVLTFETMGTPILECLQFDFEGFEHKSLHPTDQSIVDVVNYTSTSNVRAMTQRVGIQGMGDRMMDGDLMVIASIYIPAKIRMLSDQHDQSSFSSDQMPNMDGWDKENQKEFLLEKNAALIQDTEEKEKELEDLVKKSQDGTFLNRVGEKEDVVVPREGPFWHESEGCRIVVQTTVQEGDDTSFNWKLLHVDMGVFRFQDVDPDETK
jgi:hypothetical protein